ncbi:MAG: helix-turn-helix transcriptional regulator [Chloroflexi bacterium]|nr:helix-turn-helix transcriptional regulator [Chloroflexota bacterium]
MAEPWRKRLRAVRKELKLSQQQVAERAGLSVWALRGYENGRRNPSRRTLITLAKALQAPTVEMNRMLVEAGFAAEETRFPEPQFPSYFFTLDELPAAVERAPWPEWVSSERMEVLAANQAMQAVWDIDFEEERSRRTRAEMSVLSVASDHRFADRVMNWTDVVTVMARVVKGIPEGREEIDDPTPYMNAVLAAFTRNDPAFLPRLIEIWQKAEPMAAKARWDYPIIWCDPEFGEMRFHAFVTTCSEPNGWAFNDWHPVDAATWSILEQVKARHAAGAERMTLQPCADGAAGRP